jgi:hypothetical protein
MNLRELSSKATAQRLIENQPLPIKPRVDERPGHGNHWSGRTHDFNFLLAQKTRFVEIVDCPLSELFLLLQLRVFQFGLLQDGDVGIGVFPEGEEVFVGGEGPDVGGIGIRTLCLRGS